MKIKIIILLFFVGLCSVCHGNCSVAPSVPFTAAGYRTYAAWCSGCGGTPSNANGMSCTPGSTRGGGQYSGGSHLRVEQQMMLNVGSNLLRGMVQDFFTFGNDPAEEATRAQRAEQLRREAYARELQRLELERQKKEATFQKLSKELKDTGNLETSLALKGVDNSGELKMKIDEEEAKPLIPKTECNQAQAKLSELEAHGLKTFDEQIEKTKKIIEQAKEAQQKMKTERAQIFADYAAGLLSDRVKDFATNVKTIRKLKTQVMDLSLSPSETLKLKTWVENGITLGNGVIDASEKAAIAKDFNFSDPDPKKSKRKQMLAALNDFNKRFMADTGAWELAGETLAEGLGPAGPFAFKTGVLGIKAIANIGETKLEKDLAKEENQHLSNMVRTREELIKKIDSMKKELTEKCN